MLSNAPTTLALGSRVEGLVEQLQDLRLLIHLSRKYHLDNRFSEHFSFVNSLYAQAEQGYLELLCGVPTTAQPATREEIEEILKPIKTKQDVALASITDTNKIVKRIDNRDREALRRKRHRYTPDQLNSIHTLWLKAQEDPNVRLGSSRRPSIEAALKYFKKEFNALDVYSADDLRKALKAWSKYAGTKSAKK